MVGTTMNNITNWKWGLYISLKIQLIKQSHYAFCSRIHSYKVWDLVDSGPSPIGDRHFFHLPALQVRVQTGDRISPSKSMPSAAARTEHLIRVRRSIVGISKLYPLLMARRTSVSFVSIRVACVNAFSEDDLYPQKTFGAVFFSVWTCFKESVSFLKLVGLQSSLLPPSGKGLPVEAVQEYILLSGKYRL